MGGLFSFFESLFCLFLPCEEDPVIQEVDLCALHTVQVEAEFDGEIEQRVRIICQDTGITTLVGNNCVPWGFGIECYNNNIVKACCNDNSDISVLLERIDPIGDIDYTIYWSTSEGWNTFVTDNDPNCRFIEQTNDLICLLTDTVSSIEALANN